MSEKLYFITAKTKGENPKVMFLSNHTAWQLKTDQALVKALNGCANHGAIEPTHCLFVEAKDSLRQELKDIMNSDKDFVTPAELKQLIEKHNCHTVGTKKKKEKPAKEEARKYVLYRDGSAVFGQYFITHAAAAKLGACLMTLAEAEAKQKELEREGKYLWQLKKQRAKTEQRQPTQDAAEEQPQKRVGYVVFYSDVDGNKEYKTRNWGNPTEVFRTPEDAQFAADVLDSDIDTERGW